MTKIYINEKYKPALLEIQIENFPNKILELNFSGTYIVYV